jgi:hypothetical protein
LIYDVIFRKAIISYETRQKAKRAPRTPMTTCTSKSSSVSTCRFTERCDIYGQPICLFLQHGKE